MELIEYTVKIDSIEAGVMHNILNWSIGNFKFETIVPLSMNGGNLSVGVRHCINTKTTERIRIVPYKILSELTRGIYTNNSFVEIRGIDGKGHTFKYYRTGITNFKGCLTIKAYSKLKKLIQKECYDQ